jgi:hypothetical protein
LHDEIAGHDDRARERYERGPPSTEDPTDEKNPKPDAQLVFERPSNARLQAVIGPVGRRRSTVTIENEGGARHQTVTTPADQLSNRRVDLGPGGWRNNTFAFNFRQRRILARGHIRRRMAQIHIDGIALKDRRTLPVERRHGRLNQRIAAIFDLDGSLDAERLQTEVDRTLDGALRLSPGTERLWFAWRLTFPRFAAPGRAGRMPAAAALTVERLAQALKFENQRLTLRSDAATIRLATPAPIRSVEVSMILRVLHD